VRKLISILLLATFALPCLSALSALGETSESRLPACCRRNGAHHCMMSAEQKALLEEGQHFTTIHSKCPLFPKAITTQGQQTLSLQFLARAFNEVFSRSNVSPQTQNWTGGAPKGAPPKRGPPRAYQA
jgi:hypothetical protein